MFSQFFGGGGQGHGQVPRGPNAETSIEASLIDAYRGGEIDINVEMQGICDECDGSGSADGVLTVCDECQGHGIKIVRRQLAPGMIQQIQTHCEKCQGKGKIINNPCPVCHGSRVVRELRKYHLHVEPGSPKRFDHQYEGEADQSPDFTPGDLIVHVSEGKTNNMGYRRKGQDLFRTEVLSAKEALNGGWQREIPFLDGDSNLNLSRGVKESIAHGEIEKIQGMGMPIHGEEDSFGDLYIEYVVVLPGGRHESNSGHDEL